MVETSISKEELRGYYSELAGRPHPAQTRVANPPTIQSAINYAAENNTAARELCGQAGRIRSTILGEYPAATGPGPGENRVDPSGQLEQLFRELRDARQSLELLAAHLSELDTSLGT